MSKKEVRVKTEKDKNTDKSVFSIDYFSSPDKENTRFNLYSYLMESRNTVLHINTNMSASVSPEKDRDNVIALRDMCSEDNFDFYMAPAARENSGGFLGKFLNKEGNKHTAYNILINIPEKTFNRDIFDRYMCSYFIRLGIGFETDKYDSIKSDFQTGLLVPDEFYRVFEYDLFDAFEFNHIKLISDTVSKTELERIFSK